MFCCGRHVPSHQMPTALPGHSLPVPYPRERTSLHRIACPLGTGGGTNNSTFTIAGASAYAVSYHATQNVLVFNSASQGILGTVDTSMGPNWAKPLRLQRFE